MITESFDPSQSAVFDPQHVVSPNPEMPKTVVTCFAHNLIEYAAEHYSAEIIGHLHDANGATPIYRLRFADRDLALTMTSVGASIAAAGYEELFAIGAERIVVFGTCGVLDRAIAACGIILPDCAVRDEGTSYHYAPASDEIAVNVSTLPAMRAFFDSARVNYTCGKVWTTDAIYRETRDHVARRKAQGCVCVDMECAAFAALSQFRNKPIAQFFYAADNLDCEAWDKRSLGNFDSIDEKYAIVDLALALGAHLDSLE